MKSVNQNIIEKFNDLLGEEKVRVDEPMKRHTTFRIGGPAEDVYKRQADAEGAIYERELTDILDILQEVLREAKSGRRVK